MVDFSDNLDDLGLLPEEKSLEPKEREDQLDSLSKEDALSRLKKIILGSANKNDRLSAAWQLGKSGEKRAAIILLAAAKSEADEDVKSEIISALGWLKDPRAIEFLTQTLVREKNRHLRRKSAWALSNISDSQSVIKHLSKTLIVDSDERVRKEEAWSLGELGNTAAEKTLIKS